MCSLKQFIVMFFNLTFESIPLLLIIMNGSMVFIDILLQREQVLQNGYAAIVFRRVSAASVRRRLRFTHVVRAPIQKIPDVRLAQHPSQRVSPGTQLGAEHALRFIYTVCALARLSFCTFRGRKSRVRACPCP